MIRLTNIKPLLLALGFVVVVGVGLFWMWFAIGGYADQLSVQRQNLANDQANVDRSKELLAAIDETEESRMTLEQFVLQDEKDTIELLTLLEGIARTQQVTLTTRSLGVTPVEGAFDQLQSLFSIDGDASDVLRMVRLLETLPYQSEILLLEFTRESDRTASANVSLTVTIKSYDQ